MGYVRLEGQTRWVSRTLGSASHAADMRRFRDRYTPSVWLQRAVDGTHPRRLRIKIIRRSRATLVAPNNRAWQGLDRLRTGRFRARNTLPACTGHASNGTARYGLSEQRS
jgi:hypothetical protein